MYCHAKFIHGDPGADLGFFLGWGAPIRKDADRREKENRKRKAAAQSCQSLDTWVSKAPRQEPSRSDADNDSAVWDDSPAETTTSDLSQLTTVLQRDIEGSESSEVNQNEEEVETGESDPENVEEVPEYDSSTDEDEEPEDGNSIVMKIFERAIHKQLYDHLVKKALLFQFQSGFRRGHSTSTALLDVLEYILKNMDGGNLTGAIFLDLSKAFDMIDHSLLKIKLIALGVRGQALAWFDNYLSGRSQSVSVNGTYADTSDLSLGVPQGSVLGPLLFIVFINDLPSTIHRCKIILYADDTALFFAGRNIQTIQSTLQEDLNAVDEWFSLNRLLVNYDKTNVMLFGSKQRLARSQGLSLFLFGNLLELSNTVKYLGLIFDASMNWHEHINSISNKVTHS
ncbi:putative RNA-directed DNA polymerase from transposon BS [Stylophora pistillata]|uniref:Putative RNA-directed DNA polymerase from transposon BS n=1 Tax=Stylophora pistillata TaxID=50429 RepID=A0A2B4R867_STYPI|nr:putative RNA-directed DNA polymerase from transposon BS [Stylophora pistillata]